MEHIEQTGPSDNNLGPIADAPPGMRWVRLPDSWGEPLLGYFNLYGPWLLVYENETPDYVEGQDKHEPPLNLLAENADAIRELEDRVRERARRREVTDV